MVVHWVDLLVDNWVALTAACSVSPLVVHWAGSSVGSMAGHWVDYSGSHLAGSKGDWWAAWKVDCSVVRWVVR